MTLSFKVNDTAVSAATALVPFQGSYTLTIIGNSQSKQGSASAYSDDTDSRLKLSNVSGDTASTGAIYSSKAQLEYTVTIDQDGHVGVATVGASNGAFGAAWEMNDTENDPGRYITASTTMYVAVQGVDNESYDADKVDTAVKGTFTGTFVS